MTTTWTGEGQAAVFVAIGHHSAECLGPYAARRGTRFDALEPLGQGVRQHFGGFAKDIATGLSLHHDHGSQYMSDVFQGELKFLGIEGFVRSRASRVVWLAGPERVGFQGQRSGKWQWSVWPVAPLP